MHIGFMEDLKANFRPMMEPVLAFLGRARVDIDIPSKIWDKGKKATWCRDDTSVSKAIETCSYLRQDVHKLLCYCGKDVDFWDTIYV